MTPAKMAALRRLMRLRGQAVRLTKQKKYAAALETLRQAMAIAPTIFGAKHPFGAQISSQKASIHEAAESWGKAVEAYDEVIVLWRRALDVKEHEPIAVALRQKGLALLRWGKYQRAIVVLTQAVAMWHRVAKLTTGRYGPFYVYVTHGPPTMSIANCTMDLGEAYLRSRDLKRAEALSLRALAHTKGTQAPAQFLVQVNLNLAYLYQVSGRYEKGIQHLSPVVALLAKAGPEARGMHIRYLLRLAELHLYQRDFAGAQKVIARVRKLVPAPARGNEMYALLHAEVSLAELQLGTKRPKQAATLLKTLAPKVARSTSAHRLRARYHAARARLWLRKKSRRRAQGAVRQAIAALRQLKSVHPLHGLLYEMSAQTMGPGPRLLHTLVAYWALLHLGARDQPNARQLERTLCRLTKKLGPNRARAILPKARIEAQRAKIKPAGPPVCR